MMVSCMKGDVYLYDNIDGNLSGAFSLIDTFITGIYGARYDFNLTVSGGDLNNDSLTDMLIGIHTGGIRDDVGIDRKGRHGDQFHDL